MSVLARDAPEANLRAGDLGAVVHVNDDAMIEVEFVTASVRTWVVKTLSLNDVRPVCDDDLLAVRSAHSVSDATERDAAADSAIGARLAGAALAHGTRPAAFHSMRCSRAQRHTDQSLLGAVCSFTFRSYPPGGSDG